MNGQQELGGTEICALCHEDTGIPKHLHVDHPLRNGHYVETSGQLCPSCWNKVYGLGAANAKEI
ncbi:MAG: hypothetical protein AAB527_02350 [Patescibacteria group bacterium]